MPGLKLLNIDRESSFSTNPIEDIYENLNEILAYIKNLSPDAPKPRFVPLRNKLRQLQDSVSQFGSDGTIGVVEKQKAIMELHPELMMLSNDLSLYGAEFSVYSTICMNFLLNHLCSSAAADPKSQIIGVSNVMAQVLSSNMQIIDVPDFTLTSDNPNYFNEFSKEFNAMQTTAGLFAAPVLSLPDIPMSALGGWADQALQQFANVNQFVQAHFTPSVFYQIDKKENATPFDTTTDILSFYVYENEFLAALIARADLLSGLEFKITEDGIPVRLQSTEDITNLLADAIERNSVQIEKHLDTINEMFMNGIIDRNEKPDKHPDLMQYIPEAKYWKLIAKSSKLLMKAFSSVKNYNKSEYDQLNTNETLKELKLDESADDLQFQMKNTILSLEKILFEMFPSAITDQDRFIQSSDFTKFKDFMNYIIFLVAANDVLLQSKNLWIYWLIDKFGSFLLGKATTFNPIGSLKIGIIMIITGLMADKRIIINQGLEILQQTKPILEFQMHHLLACELLITLTENPSLQFNQAAIKLPNIINSFLNDFEINKNSQLYQRANLYLAMLTMYLESENNEYLRKKNERFVAFDLFSWLQVPHEFKPDFPYMPLNTSIDNLSSG